LSIGDWPLSGQGKTLLLLLFNDQFSMTNAQWLRAIGAFDVKLTSGLLGNWLAHDQPGQRYRTGRGKRGANAFKTSRFYMAPR
jgi:hypothetical protein